MNEIEIVRSPKFDELTYKVFKKDSFKCQCCGSSDKFLHIQIKYYFEILMPWQYDIDLMKSVCIDCDNKKENGFFELNKAYDERLKLEYHANIKHINLLRKIQNINDNL